MPKPPRTTVTGYYDHNYLIMAERRTDHLPRGSAPKISRQRLWKVRASQVVLATGVVVGDVKADTITVAAGSRMRGHVEFGWNESGTARLVGAVRGTSSGS